MTKNLSLDRILVLKAVDKTEIDQKVDPRLINGKNKLHAIMDPEYGHWYLQLEHGQLAEPMRQRWTSFPKLLEATKAYFLRRNIEITEIIE